MNFFCKHLYIPIIALFVFTQKSISQEINYNIGFKGILDNREFFTKYSPDYTVFGSLLNTDLNFKSGNNNINIGLNYFYEFGDIENLSKPKFHANYHYQGESDEFYFGIFKRENLINFHRILLNDTLLYSRPYVEGIFYSKKFNNASEQIWIDWTSLQSYTVRETFLVGQSGLIDLNPFFIKHQLLILHYSLTEQSGPDEHIRDNFGAILEAGKKIESFSFFDSASFSLGAMLGVDRIRSVYSWQTPIGALIEGNISYNRFMLSGLLYLGEKQNMFYGDKFYTAGNYSRWDLTINLWNKKNIKGEIVYTLHVVDSTIDHAQAIRVWIDLDYPIHLARNLNP